MSIAKRLILIHIIATGIILGFITYLIYPALNDLAQQTSDNLLAGICIKKLFYGLWGAAGISVVTSYVLSKQSLAPIKQLSSSLDAINPKSLNSRLQLKHYPKELQQLAKRCNELLTRIEDSFNQISQFSAGVAHELRNPVHMLKTATEITLTGPADIGAYQSLLEKHLEEYEHLGQLIQKLLLLSKSEHGLLSMAYVKHNVSTLLDSVMNYYGIEAEDKGITLSRTGDAEVYVDQDLFRQVFANIFDNSLRYTPAGGKVCATIYSNHSHVTISISDSGQGIPQEHLPHVKQGFYRYHANDPKLPHLGLGLALANGIIRSHQGTMEVTSEESKGTTVNIVLPINGIKTR